MNSSQRRALAPLAAAAAIGSTGLAAGGTAGALLGAQLAGTDAAAGLPLGLLVLGSAISALLISRGTVRIGYGPSLAAGYVAGAAGAIAVIVAAVTASLAALLVGSAFLGGANASVFFTRYAAAEVSGAGARGRGLGLVFFSTAIGAVSGPLLLAPSGGAAQAVGLPRLSGLYAIAAVAFGAAALIMSSAPRLSGQVALQRGPAARPPTLHELREGARAAPARIGLVVLVAANFVMVAVMAVAPVHMTGHGHDVEMVGSVISLHVAGMFAPSPLSGWLADRRGPLTAASTGLLLILGAGLGGAVVDQESAGVMTVGLVVLGLGWNFSVVGGSALIAGSVRPSLRIHVEGIGEAAMGVAAATAAPLAGLLLDFAGFAPLSLAGAATAFGALAVVRSQSPASRRLGVVARRA